LVQVMQVALGATLNRSSQSPTAARSAILNDVLLIVNTTFFRNVSFNGGARISNEKTLIVTNSTFSRPGRFDPT